MLLAMMKRELAGYFYSPVAYVFITIFTIFSMVLTIFIGDFFESNTASMEIFFLFHPWLYAILIPAVSMRLWAEERNTGTIELLFTLPLSMFSIVLGKFLAAWIFIGTALLLTFPMIITVYILGSPDGGIIFVSYLGSFLMAGSYLSIGCLTSALTRNQVISFVISATLCLSICFLGWGVFNNMLAEFVPVYLADSIAAFSFTYHFDVLRKGLIDTRDVIYFISIIMGGLLINGIVLDYKK